MKRKKRLIIISILLLIIFAFIAYKFYIDNRGDKDIISGTGTIETAEVIVSSKVEGRIANLYIDKGTKVKKGQVIAEIERVELKELAREAETKLKLARTHLSQAETLATLGPQITNARIEQAKSNLAQAKASLENTEKDLLRIKRLFEQGAVSQQQFDAIQTKYTLAYENLNTAESNLELALSNRLDNKVKEDEVEKAKSQLKLAETGLELIRIKLAETTIRSPLEGTVLVKSIEEGELVGPGTPIATIANLDDIWVKIYIKEADLGRVKLDQAARVTIDSFPNRIFKGNIHFISQEAEFTPKNIQTREERIKQVFGVEIKLLNPQGIIKPGMPADAEILTNGNYLATD
ncbi:MAG: efflux RND transporter periplasmic adaptor subunit [bacterium]